MKKNLEPTNWVQNEGFWHFLKVASLVFLDIAQDCSLGQCLTSRRAEISWKKVCGRNDHFYSNVVECILKRGCFFFLLLYLLLLLVFNPVVFSCFRKPKRESLIIIKLLKACNLTSATYPFSNTFRNCCKSYILGDLVNIYTGIHPVFTWLWAAFIFNKTT